MTRFTVSFLACVFILLCVDALGQDTVAHWSFNESKGGAVKELVSNTAYPVHTVRKSIEHVNGISGRGLRTDGNSTWITGSLPQINKPFTITGWFALETYPTDTAGFFSIADTTSDNWISACMDKFGMPLIGVKNNGVLKYFGGTERVLKFRWLQVGLLVNENSIELFINGEKTGATSSEQNFFKSPYNHIVIGRDSRMKYVHIFPVTAINGIIDEVVIRQGNSTLSQLHPITEQATTAPDLSIPLQRFKSDFNRPGYHLLPAANWTNETHGLIFYNKKYHIFNQKNGTNAYLGQINWGHFSSPDLIQWTEHLPAITPEPGYDERGAWSGHVVLEKGEPVIAYSSGSENFFNVALAFPKDDSLVLWEKFKGNPIISGQPEGFTRNDLHDPYLWKEDSVWYMIIGFGEVEGEEKKGSVLLYKSTDLKKWAFLHPLFAGNPKEDNSGVFWEMPVFWKLNGKYILLVNKVPTPQGPAVALYWTGDFKNEKFVPYNPIPKRLEVVNRLLSPSVALDEKGRTTAIAIIPDEISAKAQYQQGWTHLYSIPRVWILENGTIHQQPHPNLVQLREGKKSFSNKIIQPTSNLVLRKGKHQVEIIADVLPEDCKKFGFIIGKDEKGREVSKIYYDFTTAEFVVDQTESSRREGIPQNIRTGKYDLKQNEKVKFHVFIDGSVVEVFINGKDAFTTRLFPKYGESNAVELFAEGGRLKLLKADVWDLKKVPVVTDFKVPATASHDVSVR